MDNEKGHNRPGHDGLFKLFLREPDTARDFLAVHLPADIRAQVRLDTLKLEPGSFVDQKLRELHSDVLYSVETAEGHAGYIYCLVEHQSTADRMMAWRMMRYSMAVMDAHLKKGNDTLPVVVPLLFYQGTVRPYPYSTDWMDCFDAPALAREVYSRPWTGRNHGLAHCRLRHGISAYCRAYPEQSAGRGRENAAVGEQSPAGPTAVVAGSRH